MSLDERVDPATVEELEAIAGVPKKCGGCAGGLVENPESGDLERHAACGGEGVRR